MGQAAGSAVDPNVLASSIEPKHPLTAGADYQVPVQVFAGSIHWRRLRIPWIRPVETLLEMVAIPFLDAAMRQAPITTAFARHEEVEPENRSLFVGAGRHILI